MKFEIYKCLPEEVRDIRIKVFIEEQGFENEFDETDSEAVHFLVKEDDGLPLATCRIFRSDKMNSYVLGRLAVLKEYRGMGLGSETVRKALDYVASEKGEQLMLHSQCSATGFYEKLGFEAFGEVEYEENCPHIWMKKEL